MAKRKSIKNKIKYNDLQNTTQKTEDWASRTPLKTEDDEPSCSGMVRSFCFTNDSSYMFCKITETAIADCFLHTGYQLVYFTIILEK